MKKIFSCIAILTTILIIFNSSNLLADNSDEDTGFNTRISAGFQLHYAWLDPVWSEQVSNPALAILGISTSDISMGTESSFFYNPIFGVKFSENWSVTVSFQYGKLEYEADFFYTSGFLFTGSLEYSVTKIDTEVLINYSITDTVKLFFGPKYQGYLIQSEVTSLGLASLLPFEDIEFHSGGIGAGIGFTFNIADNLYLLPNLGGILLFGKDVSNPALSTKTSLLVGGIGTISLAYVIPSINLTLTAGFKAQYLYFTTKPSELHVQSYDFYYGPNISVVYTF